MRHTRQIVGFPIISINDGNKIGTVNSLVVNAELCSVDFLTIQHEDWQVSERAVPFKKVIGIGDFAVTIESANFIIDLSEIPIAHELATKKIKIIGAKVMTRKGELLGETTEFYIDELNGKIIGLSIKDAQSEYFLSAEYIVTLGRDITVVSEEAVNHRLDHVSQLEKGAGMVEESVKIEQVAEQTENINHPLSTKEIQRPDEDLDASEDAFLNNDIELINIKEKQMSILEGKEVTQDIHNPEGDLIVSKGTRLDRELLFKIIEESPELMVDLAMNVR